MKPVPALERALSRDPLNRTMKKNCTLLPASSAIGLPQPNMLTVPWLSRRKWVR